MPSRQAPPRPSIQSSTNFTTPIPRIVMPPPTSSSTPPAREGITTAGGGEAPCLGPSTLEKGRPVGVAGGATMGIGATGIGIARVGGSEGVIATLLQLGHRTAVPGGASGSGEEQKLQTTATASVWSSAAPRARARAERAPSCRLRGP